MSRTRLVIADDEPLVREGLRLILELDPQLELVAEAGDGAEAIELVRRHRPDLALFDIRMPLMDGIEATRQLCADQALDATRVVAPLFVRSCDSSRRKGWSRSPWHRYAGTTVHAATNARCHAAGHGLSESRARAMVGSPLERDPGG